jgi:hypothetical protein
VGKSLLWVFLLWVFLVLEPVLLPVLLERGLEHVRRFNASSESFSSHIPQDNERR